MAYLKKPRVFPEVGSAGEMKGENEKAMEGNGRRWKAWALAVEGPVTFDFDGKVFFLTATRRLNVARLEGK